MPTDLLDWLKRYASRLRFPYLFAIVAAIFLADLLLPDLIPFVDEILLGLVTVLLGSLRRRPKAGEGPESTDPTDRSLPPARPS